MSNEYSFDEYYENPFTFKALAVGLGFVLLQHLISFILILIVPIMWIAWILNVGAFIFYVVLYGKFTETLRMMIPFFLIWLISGIFLSIDLPHYKKLSKGQHIAGITINESMKRDNLQLIKFKNVKLLSDQYLRKYTYYAAQRRNGYSPARSQEDFLFPLVDSSWDGGNSIDYLVLEEGESTNQPLGDKGHIYAFNKNKYEIFDKDRWLEIIDNKKFYEFAKSDTSLLLSKKFRIVKLLESEDILKVKSIWHFTHPRRYGLLAIIWIVLSIIPISISIVKKESF